MNWAMKKSPRAFERYHAAGILGATGSGIERINPARSWSNDTYPNPLSVKRGQQLHEVSLRLPRPSELGELLLEDGVLALGDA